MVGKKLVSKYFNPRNDWKGLLIPAISGLTLLVLLLQLTLNPFSFLTQPKPQPGTSSAATSATGKTTTGQDYAKTPLSFIEQPGDQPQFLARGKGYSFALNATEAVLTLTRQQNSFANPQTLPANPAKTTPLDLKTLRTGKTGSPAPKVTSATVRMKLEGANPAPQMTGQQEQPSKTNYFLGTDSSKWRTNVMNYGQVLYKGVYPGTDLLYYGNDQNQFEYDFILAPGADPSKIKINFEGADRLATNDKGELVIQLDGGSIIQHAPVIYQERNGVKTTVAGHYLLLPDNRVSFELGQYDKTLPLTIDPSISYSTFLGGNSADAGFDIAVDSSGAAYVVGFTGDSSNPTASNTFPTYNAYDSTYNGDIDIFISKFNTDGTLAYSTFLGGSGDDEATSIAVDSSGNAYFAGFNYTGGFPMIGPSYKTTNSGQFDAIVGKLNPSGSLVYSTYLGGTKTEQAAEIAVDSAGTMYITGSTDSYDFPTVSPLQPHLNLNTDPNNQYPHLDIFVAKIDTNGNLVYSTYLGGTFDDIGKSIALGSAGSFFVLGSTDSTDYPLYSPSQSQNKGDQDLVITKFDSGNNPVYSTYLGGKDTDVGTSIAVNSLDEAIIVGQTKSTDFPMYSPFQSNYQGFSGDGFVARLDSSGSPIFSTFLGGIDGGTVYAVAVDGTDSFTVVGVTGAGFPNFYAFQPYQIYSGSFISNGFITRFDSNNNVSYSSYYGWGGTALLGVAVQSDGTAYVAGYGPPPGAFFGLYNPFQGNFGGEFDTYVAKIKAPIYVVDNTQQAVQNALNQAATNGGEVLVTTFVSTLTLTSNLNIPNGVSLVADCGYGDPSLEIDGPGTITLHGNSQLIGVKLKHIKVTNDGYNNLAQCLVVDNTP